MSPTPLEESLARIHERLPARIPADQVPEVAAAVASVEERVMLEHALAADRERWETLAPARFREATLDDWSDDDAGAAKAIGWLGTRDRNVVVTGTVGTGKTHLVMGMARHLVAAGESVGFKPAAEMLDELRPGGPDDALDRLCHPRWSPRILIIDDLGAERPTDWTAERVAVVINRRWLEEMPVVATTNLTPGADGSLLEVLGDRTYSRLCGGALGINLAGEDRRLGR